MIHAQGIDWKFECTETSKDIEHGSFATRRIIGDKRCGNEISIEIGWRTSADPTENDCFGGKSRYASELVHWFDRFFQFLFHFTLFKKDQQIKRLQRRLKDSEEILSRALFQARQKLASIATASKRPVASEELIKYAYRLVFSFSIQIEVIISIENYNSWIFPIE